ncbi:CBS domain-containing protein [Mangrovicoccus algicola]|uniref:CBS domain-containing protein n=1 Tax=Mangrovicoccus algicola TaxID=2771008 RepID=A0A8J6YSE6_9RHOB|nr:CBS domain-containing protein [Mangrovicoccus algicola]MBE3636625.1 CBS domain-containing protein [Mangrovicoccus algicola]
MVIRSVAEAIRGQALARAAPGDSLRQACLAMRAADAAAVAVMTGPRLEGILCETDVIRRGICESRGMDVTQVAEVMTRDPRSIGADAGLAEALDVMLKAGIRHLPVLAAGQVAGILSMRDIPAGYRVMVDRFLAARAGPRPLEERARPH